MESYIKPINRCAICGRVSTSRQKKSGELKKSLVKGLVYDKFQCKTCNKSSNRHSNVTQVSAPF